VTIEQAIVEAARREGFVLVGFARLRRLDRRAEFYHRWLDANRHADMAWLARDPERRFDPRVLDSRLRSVVSLAYPYVQPAPPAVDWRAELRGRIAAYAFGLDYHDRVLKKSQSIAGLIAAMRPGAVTRNYVDTGPVFEREWAAESGLGWMGKNTNLLNREQGSYFFLSEIFTDIELEPNREPYSDHCGTCRRCLDLCPTGALADGFVMDARLCISYLTIENRGSIDPELRPKLGNWIFGCDICQQVCPWNDPHAAAGAEELAPRLPELLALDDDGFRRRYGKSAVKRAKRRGLLRNVCVALGNSGNPDAVAPLIRALESEPEAIVRAHAAWALGRLGGCAARAALDRRSSREPDTEVSREIKLALDEMRANG